MRRKPNSHHARTHTTPDFTLPDTKTHAPRGSIYENRRRDAGVVVFLPLDAERRVDGLGRRAEVPPAEALAAAEELPGFDRRDRPRSVGGFFVAPLRPALVRVTLRAPRFDADVLSLEDDVLDPLRGGPPRGSRPIRMRFCSQLRARCAADSVSLWG